jgi:hypothetical protein
MTVSKTNDGRAMQKQLQARARHLLGFDPDKALSPADGLPSQSRSDFVAGCARMPSTEGAVRRSTQAVIGSERSASTTDCWLPRFNAQSQIGHG